MMLFAIREKAKGWFAWLIVLLISVPFALWGIGSYITPDPNPPVAVVNGLGISSSEFQSALQQEQNQTVAAPQDENLTRQVVLRRLINNRALLSHLNEQGYVNSQASLDQEILLNSNFTDLKTGQFSQDKFNQYLRQMGVSYTTYRSLLSSDMMVKQYINGINLGSFVTKEDEDRLLRLLKQQRDVDYVLINSESFKANTTVTSEEITHYYEQNKEQYEVPEQVKLAYLDISRKDIAKTIDVSEVELVKSYEENKGKYTTNEERQASHILIPIDETLDEDKANKLIDSIHQRLVNGEDFAVVAKETSKDTGSAVNGGDLGFFKKGDMVPEFDSATFALAINEVSKPFKSSFGFHIVKLTAIKAETIKPLADVKDKLKLEVQYDKAEKMFVEKSELLQTIAYEQPDALDAAASAIDRQIKFSELFSKQGGSSNLFSSPKVIKAAFSDLVLEEGSNSDLIEVNTDHVLVIRVEQRVEAKIKELAIVSEQIKKDLLTKKLADQTFALAEKLQNAFKDKSENFEQLLKEHQLEKVQKGFVERNDRSLRPVLVSKAFKLPRVSGDSLGIAAAVKVNSNESAVVIVKNVKDGTIDDETMRASMSGLLAQSESSLLTNLSISQISKQSDIEIHAERINPEL